MTLPKLSSLTPEQIRVMIAEVLGVVECGEWDHLFHGVMGKRGTCAHPNCVPIGRTPKYDEDLNAMAEAEKVLTASQVRWFEEYLDRIVFKATTDSDWSEGSNLINTKAWHATATQRAQAFLLAIGKAQP